MCFINIPQCVYMPSESSLGECLHCRAEACEGVSAEGWDGGGGGYSRPRPVQTSNSGVNAEIIAVHKHGSWRGQGSHLLGDIQASSPE